MSGDEGLTESNDDSSLIRTPETSGRKQGPRQSEISSHPIDILEQSYIMNGDSKSRGLIIRSFRQLIRRISNRVSSAADVSTISRPTVSRRSFACLGDSSALSDRRSSYEDFYKEVIIALESRQGSNNPLKSRIPGAIGISNHGNTCFVNAVIQCLSNTERFSGYLVSGHYQDDARRARKQRGNGRRNGAVSELSDRLIALMKGLWLCDYRPSMSAEFLAAIRKVSRQYEGNTQHDAQEFLLWLLDKLHEDLNIINKKKNRIHKSTLSTAGKSEDVLAAEALTNYTRCNNSFVYDRFQAVYRSSLVCPGCGHQSNTYEPFLCISLPIPNLDADKNRQSAAEETLEKLDEAAELVVENSVSSIPPAPPLSAPPLPPPSLPSSSNNPGIEPGVCSETTPTGTTEGSQANPTPSELASSENCVFVTVVYQCATPRQVRIGLSLPFDSSVLKLRETLSEDTSIDVNQMMIMRIEDYEYGEIYGDSEPTSDLHDIENIFAIELPSSSRSTAQHVAQCDSVCEDSDEIIVLLLNVVSEGQQLHRFTEPVAVKVSIQSSMTSLQADLLDAIRWRLRADYQRDVDLEDKFLFQLYVVDKQNGTVGKHPLIMSNAALMSNTVQNNIIRPAGLCADKKSMGYVKLVAIWNRECMQNIVYNCTESIAEHASVQQVRMKCDHVSADCSLSKCLQVYTQQENLFGDDAWLCPSCKQRLQGTIKSLSLWSLPDVLVIHIKRFKQETSRRIKLNSLVSFPLEGLNMSSVVPASRLSALYKDSSGATSTLNATSSGAAWGGSSAKLSAGSNTANTPLYHKYEGLSARKAGIVDTKATPNDIGAEGAGLGYKKSANGSGEPTRKSGAGGRKIDPADNYTYDLYAVCNHHGSLNNGHYTAVCKNPITCEWFSYNDSSVKLVSSEDDIVTRSAYLLFYVKRSSSRRDPMSDLTSCPWTRRVLQLIRSTTHSVIPHLRSATAMENQEQDERNRSEDEITVELDASTNQQGNNSHGDVLRTMKERKDLEQCHSRSLEQDQTYSSSAGVSDLSRADLRKNSTDWVMNDSAISSLCNDTSDFGDRVTDYLDKRISVYDNVELECNGYSYSSQNLNQTFARESSSSSSSRDTEEILSETWNDESFRDVTKSCEGGARDLSVRGEISVERNLIGY